MAPCRIDAGALRLRQLIGDVLRVVRVAEPAGLEVLRPLVGNGPGQGRRARRRAELEDAPERYTFAENNLNRQACCTEGNLGQQKTEAAKARLAAVNSATQVTVHPVMADDKSMQEMLTGADVVVDALDTISTRLILQKVVQGLGSCLVQGAIAG